MRSAFRLLIAILLIGALALPAAAVGMVTGPEPAAASEPASDGSPLHVFDRLLVWIGEILGGGDGEASASESCPSGGSSCTNDDGPGMDPNG
jgi:hypothetical protein